MVQLLELRVVDPINVGHVLIAHVVPHRVLFVPRLSQAEELFNFSPGAFLRRSARAVPPIPFIFFFWWVLGCRF